MGCAETVLATHQLAIHIEPTFPHHAVKPELNHLPPPRLRDLDFALVPRHANVFVGPGQHIQRGLHRSSNTRLIERARKRHQPVAGYFSEPSLLGALLFRIQGHTPGSAQRIAQPVTALLGATQLDPARGIDIIGAILRPQMGKAHFGRRIFRATGRKGENNREHYHYPQR